MKLPLVKGRQLFCPRRPLCPVCKKSKILEPHSFAVLTGGALIMDRRRRNGRMDDALDGFLDLVWHGSHDGGEGIHPETSARVTIADSVRGGQFDIYVCSTRCLRKLFDEWVDRLEDALKTAKRDQRKRGRRSG